MRSDHMERLVILPFFSIGGCISDSSVAVSNNSTNYENQHCCCSNKKSTKPRSSSSSSSSNQSSPPRTVAGILKEEGDHHQSLYGLQKLIKNFKAFSHQFFVNKEDDHIGEMKMEMEIGFPTDVKHVTKIGWDGSTATSIIKDWDIDHHELFSINPRPSQLPLRQHFNLSAS